LYFSDFFCRVRRWNPEAGATTVAGDDGMWGCGYGGDGGPATRATLSHRPHGVAVDASGTMYLADTENHCVRAVDPAGTIVTVAGHCGVQTRGDTLGDGGVARGGTLSRPMGIAVDPDGNLYIADSGNRRIRKVGVDGIITTVAGNGEELP
jgi:DNA-binding beta-propeller fold protein YncE